MTSALAAQQATIRVPVRLVNLATLVVSKDDRLLTDLQAANFRVFDNGRLQSVTMETSSAPLSVVLAVQVNQDVRAYLPFIAKAGSVVESFLGEGGEFAVITYGDEVRIVKEPRQIRPAGDKARTLDAGSAAIALLTKRPRSRPRILLFLGQPADNGSESDLDSLRQQAEKEDVVVYSLTLPLAGRAFVSDTFSLNGVSRAEKGGFRVGADAKKLAAVLSRSADAEAGRDPFSVLTAATGGARFHFRTQQQLEGAIAALGVQLRSAYTLSYYPTPADTGYHNVKVDVDVPAARVYTRPGYWLSADSP